VHEPGHIAGIVGPILTALGAGLVLLSAVITLAKGGNTKSPALTPWSPLSRRLRASARGQVQIAPEELPALQAGAKIWVRQRWQLLLCFGASIAQFGSNISAPGPRRYRFTIAFTAFMAVLALFTERRARLGAAFLASHPIPQPANPPESPKSPGEPQPGSL